MGGCAVVAGREGGRAGGGGREGARKTGKRAREPENEREDGEKRDRRRPTLRGCGSWDAREQGGVEDVRVLRVSQPNAVASKVVDLGRAYAGARVPDARPGGLPSSDGKVHWCVSVSKM